MEKLPRVLSEHEISFLEEVKYFNQVLDFTAQVSLNQGGIDADGRGVRAVKIFTRQTITAFSFSKILPKPKVSTTSDTELWDISSVASLTRNLIEGYLSLNYFGLEKNS